MAWKSSGIAIGTEIIFCISAILVLAQSDIRSAYIDGRFGITHATDAGPQTVSVVMHAHFFQYGPQKARITGLVFLPSRQSAVFQQLQCPEMSNDLSTGDVAWTVTLPRPEYEALLRKRLLSLRTTLQTADGMTSVQTVVLHTDPRMEVTEP